MYAVNSEIFFVADILFFGLALDLDDYIILADMFYLGVFLDQSRLAFG